jgi:ubiquinone/menaquinone biosynthesis C-methylase UbiE
MSTPTDNIARSEEVSLGSTPPDSRLKEVNAFWNTAACGTHFVTDFETERDFYEKFRKRRYQTEWHILELVPFDAARGKRVLEIGTGNGADGAMFALSGANYTGVDLTPAALEATRKHFAVLGLHGTFHPENAESLSFPDESFDLVYSHGVLHHTPNTQKAVDEVWRVLKPNGRAIVMLYHKHSFNYYVRIMLYMRARVLLKILSRFGNWRRDRSHLQNDGVVGVRGNRDDRVWDIHYRNFLRRGWSYLDAKNFVHHCTDGPECPVAQVFTKTEAARLFGEFSNVQFQIAHFPLTHYIKHLPFALERYAARYLGWYLFIFAMKPQR